MFVDFFHRLKITGAQRQLVINYVILCFFILERLYGNHQTLNFGAVTPKVLILQSNILVVWDHVLDANCFIHFSHFHFILVTRRSKSLLGSWFHVSFGSKCSTGTVVLNWWCLLPLLLGTPTLGKSVSRPLVGTTIHIGGIGRDLWGLRLWHGIEVRKLGQVILGICNGYSSEAVQDLLARILWGVWAVRFAFNTLWEILYLVCIWNFACGQVAIIVTQVCTQNMHYCFVFASRNVVGAASIDRAVEYFLTSLRWQGKFCLYVWEPWVDRALSCKIHFFGGGRIRCQFTQISFKSTICWKLLCKIADQLFDGPAKERGIRALVPFENSEGFVDFESFLDESVDLLVAEVFHHDCHLSCWKYILAGIHQIRNSSLGIILDGESCPGNRSHFSLGLLAPSFDFV